MSLISDALKTAQRERSERVDGAPSQRNLVEGFFPLGPTPGNDSGVRKSTSYVLAAVAILAVGGAIVLRDRRHANAPPPKPIVLPALPNQSAAAAPRPAAPTLSAAPSVPAGPGAPASKSGALTAVSPADRPTGVASQTQAPARTSAAAQSAVPAPAEPKATTGTGGVATVADSSASAQKQSVPAPAVAAPTIRSAPPPSSQPVRISVEGGSRGAADHLAADALSAQQQGNFDRAQELYERAIVGSPTSDVFNNYGVLLLQRGDTAAAIFMYKRAVRLDPTKVEAWANLGEALDQRGIHGEATSAFQQVLKLDPSNVRARIQLAAQYSALGSPGDARRILEEATRSAPKDPAGHYALAGFFVSQHDVPSAIREFDQFLSLAPGVYDQKTIDGVKAYVASLRTRP